MRTEITPPNSPSRDVDVIIRTLNESELIGRCLETLQRQQGNFNLDVVVVDSGSTDTTIEIARSFKMSSPRKAPNEFDYSKALNVGIGAAAGELVEASPCTRHPGR